MNTAFKISETEKLRPYIGDNLYELQESAHHLCLSLENGAYLFKLEYRNLNSDNLRLSPVTIYCSDDDFLIFSDYLSLPEDKNGVLSDAPFKMLALFLDELTENDADILDSYEAELGKLEQRLLNSTKELTSICDITDERRALSLIKRYYDQLDGIFDTLVQDELSAVPKNVKTHFTVLSHRVDHLCATVDHLREYITQLREEYQAQVDIEQNEIMKIFTVLTAVFLPLSLIVGWYGMNFKMPEYGWKHGYLFLIIFSIAVCLWTYRFIKHKKWF